MRYLFLGAVMLWLTALLSLITYKVGLSGDCLFLRERTLSFGSVGWPFLQKRPVSSLTEVVPEFVRSDEIALGDHEFSRVNLVFGEAGSFPLIRAWLGAEDFYLILRALSEARPGLVPESALSLAEPG